MRPESSRRRGLEHEHTRESIRERLAGGIRHSYVRDWIFGGIDGAVTTFAVVSGAAGAELGFRVVVILGIANLVADGFSMGASNYLGTSAERDQLAQIAAIERRHIATDPEGEREEVRAIFERKGLEGVVLDAVVDEITSDQGKWIETMLTEEYGLPREARSPRLAGLSTFSAFVLCGFVPLLPFVFRLDDAFRLAGVLTALVFLTVGALKGRWSTRSAWWSAIETLVIGSAAAGLAYAAGAVLKHVLA